MNWDLVRAFVSVAQKGSLSAAARELGLSQPTLSRQIQALEKDTQLQLFQRSTQGLLLTEAGQRLLAAAEDMSAAADLFQRQVSGLSEYLQGTVRVSANEIVGLYLLPPALAAFREQNPGIQVELLISNSASSLNRREADIALRMFRPHQTTLKARRLPDLKLGFYAHRRYLEQRGIPQDLTELQAHSLIGFDQDMQFVEAAEILGYALRAEDFDLRCDQMPAQIQLARAGAGILVTHVELARHWPELQPLLTEVPLPALEFWIVSHVDTQYSARIRTLSQFLGDWFAREPYRRALV